MSLGSGAMGRWLVRVFREQGVRQWFVSPGSRSTPLAMGAHLEAASDVHVVLDERSAGFRALGWSKATGAPVGLICTSGSALAHYLPAIIEASETGLPLVVISADRPPELRACHAGQTIDQVKLFGSFVRYYLELPVAGEAGCQPAMIREIGRRALDAAQRGFGGPVHLNCPFREPLYEGANVDLPECQLPRVALQSMPAERDDGLLEIPPRTLILSGALPGRLAGAQLASVLQWSRERCLPVLADGVSPLRAHQAETPYLITQYDRMARMGDLEALRPDALLLVGEPPVSKELRRVLAGWDLPGWQIGPGKPGMNPFFGNIEVLSGRWPELRLARPRDAAFADAWAQADARMAARLEQAMAQPHPLFEGDLHRALAELLPEGTPLFYANSMAMRDADWFTPPTIKRFETFAQRGANGIDGTLSTARGIASGMAKPTVLVIGDLAFLHDSNGLLGSAMDRTPLLVVLINNGGGGIFHFLPVAEDAAFESLFATPQAVDFGGLVRAHGGHHRICADLAAFSDAVQAWPQHGLSVIEVPVDRIASARLHRELLKLSLPT